MNRERAKKLLPVIKHFANGGEIQQRFRHGNWVDYDGITHFDDSDFDFRIKPEPREFWIGQYPGSGQKWSVYDGEGPPTPLHNEWIKVREVLNDE